jgi:hypothetical protein
MSTIGNRLKHAWNAFTNSDSAQNRPFSGEYGSYGGIFGGRPDRTPLRFSNERTIISAIYARIGIDVAAVPMVHCRTDDQDRYLETIDSGLNSCLSLEANIDQAGRAFRQDVAQTILDEGVAAIVPVDTTVSPEESGGYDIKTMRVGRITGWFPKHVRVSLYNEERGMREEITLPKKMVAIVENPLYSVMNEPNSTLQRLIVKLGLLDAVDNQSASGKLDIIIQLPYTIRSESKRTQAEQRRKDIEFQLAGSKYGIAYADATEKITQLNRPAENNLMTQVTYLTEQLYAQLGITPEVMTGTADEKVMLNYYARTIEPLLDSIVEAMRRTFLTKTARTQGQTIMYFRDPFKFVPIGGEGGIADIADKFSRNEIVSSNEIRQAIGMRPRPEAKADALINSNMPQADTGVDPNADAVDSTAVEIPPDPAADRMIEDLTGTNAQLDAILNGGG